MNATEQNIQQIVLIFFSLTHQKCADAAKRCSAHHALRLVLISVDNKNKAKVLNVDQTCDRKNIAAQGCTLT